MKWCLVPFYVIFEETINMKCLLDYNFFYTIKL